ncbi:MAG: hypothetical protein ABI743_04350 [bacterium]
MPTHYGEIWRLGWPLFLGLGIAAALGLRLRDEWGRVGHQEPMLIQRALLFFVEGDVLRALVLLEGEEHPLCRILSGFWKAIPQPRQWEGTRLIAEYQNQRTRLLDPYRRTLRSFGQLCAVVVLLQLGWLMSQAPGGFRQAPPDLLATTPFAGILWTTVLVGLWGWVTCTQINGQFLRLAAQGDQVIYRSVEALEESRAGRRATPVSNGTMQGRPANVVAQAYRR